MSRPASSASRSNVKNIVIYVATIVVSAGLAVGVWWKVRDTPTSSEVVILKDDPLWYRELTPQERRMAARSRLDTMTSNTVSAASIGPMKDEIALLCHDEDVVDLVVESYRDRKDLNSAQISAFLEVFARVRHEKFGPLLAQGLREYRAIVRHNAIDAALVQQHPETVPYLIETLAESEGARAQRILTALARIGTGDALAAIVRAIDHESADARSLALRIAGQGGIHDAVPAARRLAAEDPDPLVRVLAGWTLVRLGQSVGLETLEAVARDREASIAARAQAVQCIAMLGRPEATRALKDLTTSTHATVAFEARIALATLRDEATVAALRSELDSGNRKTRLDALAALGRTGSDDDVAVVTEAATRLIDQEIAVFVQSVGVGLAPAGLEFCAQRIRNDGTDAVLAIGQLANWGEAAVPVIEDLLSTDDRDVVLRLFVTLTAIHTTKALDVLESQDLRFATDRRMRRHAREAIRLLEQRLLKGEIS